MKNAIPTQFDSNIGSPQGDSISGPIFTVYLERALKDIREAIDQSPIDVRDINLKWIERDNSELPNELVYADDCDFVTEDQKKKETALQHVQEILPQFNLLINNSKTEHTVIKRQR